MAAKMIFSVELCYL